MNSFIDDSILFSDQSQQQSNGTMKSYSTSGEMSVGRGEFRFSSSSRFVFDDRILVADYDPLNDDRGSLARGYEPTSKAMQSTSQLTRFSM